MLFEPTVLYAFTTCACGASSCTYSAPLRAECSAWLRPAPIGLVASTSTLPWSAAPAAPSASCIALQRDRDLAQLTATAPHGVTRNTISAAADASAMLATFTAGCAATSLHNKAP